MIHFHSKQILLYQLLCIVTVKYDMNLKFYAKDLMKNLERTEVFLKHTAEKFDRLFQLEKNNNQIIRKNK